MRLSWARTTYGAIGVTCYQHAWRIAAVVVVLLAASPLLLADLAFETVTSGTTTEDDEVTGLYRDNLERFGDASALVILLRPGGLDNKGFDALTTLITARLRALPGIVTVDARLVDSDHPRVVDATLRAVVANADPAVFAELRERLTPEGVSLQLRRTRRNLVAADDPAARSLIAADPLGIAPLVRPHFAARGVAMRLSERSTYFDAADGGGRLIFIRPEKPAEDGIFTVQLVADVRDTLDELIAVPSREGVTYGLGGTYAMVAESMQALNGELPLISAIAGVLIVGLIWLALRQAQAVVICFGPLAVAFVAALVTARLLYNPLHSVTMAFAPVILGLAVDALLHSTARFFRIPATVGPEEAVRRTLADCGPPITIGMLTTAAAFATMFFARYEPLQEFGLVTATGLLAAFVFTLCLFPVAVRLTQARPAGRGDAVGAGHGGSSYWSFAARSPHRALALSAVALLLGLWLARDFSFEMDLYKNLPANLEAISVDREITESFGLSFLLSSQLHVSAATLPEALAGQHAVDTVLEHLVAEGIAAGFASVSTLVAYDDSSARLSELAGHVAESREPYFRTLDELGFRQDSEMSAAWEALERALAEPVDEPRSAALQARLRRFLAVEEERAHLRTLVWSTDSWRRPEAVAEAAAEARSRIKLPNGVSLRVTGVYEAFHRVNELVRTDFLRVGALAAVVVAALVTLALGDWRAGGVCLLTVGAAVPVMLALVSQTGWSFTPSAIGVVAIVIGIGIDDALHLVTRRVSGSQVEMRKILVEIGPVLALTSLTTALAFGALTASSFYSIASLGFAVVVGTMACLLFALLMVPALALMLLPTIDGGEDR